MPHALPAPLGSLLEAKDEASRDACWEAFVSAYSRLLLHVTRSGSGQYDGAMDRYAHVLDQLRQDDFRRLRAYVADGRSEFTTWLVVVAQRLCFDHSRARYGRFRPAERDASRQEAERLVRRRLADLIGATVDMETLGARPGEEAEAALHRSEVEHALDVALRGLDSRDRLLIKLRFEDGLSMSEVSGHLGFPNRFHVYRRLREVLAILRRVLEARGIREASP